MICIRYVTLVRSDVATSQDGSIDIRERLAAGAMMKPSLDVALTTSTCPRFSEFICVSHVSYKADLGDSRPGCQTALKHGVEMIYHCYTCRLVTCLTCRLSSIRMKLTTC